MKIIIKWGRRKNYKSHFLCSVVHFLGWVAWKSPSHSIFYFHTAQRCDNWKIKRTCHSCLQLWCCCMQRRVYFPLCVALLSLIQSVGRADRQTGLLKVTAVWSGQSCTQSGPGIKWLGTCRTRTPRLWAVPSLSPSPSPTRLQEVWLPKRNLSFYGNSSRTCRVEWFMVCDHNNNANCTQSA